MNYEINQLKEQIKSLKKENLSLTQKKYEINQAKELYLKIFEEFPALIWRSRLDKLCDYFNKTWFEFTGRTMEQEFGNGWAEGVHPDDFNYCLKIYVEAFDKREPFLMEYRLKNKDGEYRWIRDFGRPFYDLDNTFLGYIGSCYDITENKNYELKMTELNSTKDKLFSIIAHDLRNPFSSIMGLTELLYKNHRKYDQKKMEELTRQLYLSAENTYNILENLLEWSISQTNKITFNPKILDFETICQDIITNLESNSKIKNIFISYNSPVKIEIFADPDLLKTILRNLISNAIKFTNKNGKIEISAEEEKEKTIISVTDNGVGIDKNKIDSIFDISHKQTTTGTASEKGTGLGLTICKEFVEKHNGEIWVESESGKGTRILFTLPRQS